MAFTGLNGIITGKNACTKPSSGLTNGTKHSTEEHVTMAPNGVIMCIRNAGNMEASLASLF